MNCKFNERYELGKLDEEAYMKHTANCSVCQSILEKDKQLMELSGKLRQPIHAPNLWKNIERNIQQERERKSNRIMSLQRYKTPIYAMAAIFILAIGLTVYFSKTGAGQNSPSLLAKTLLQEVKETESAYEDAISGLEEATQNRFSEMDLELTLLYRDRLETIDIQIARCKTALNENPANTHIRRYLLAALQDKKETLNEVLNLEIQQL